MAKSVLGIAFAPNLIQIAELSYDAKSAKLLRAAEYHFIEGDSYDKPVELAKKLTAFLKANKFSAKQVIAGLPTQWLMLKEKTVPPMSAVNLAGMLRLQAERDFSLEPNDLVIDFTAGETDASDAATARSLLLAAAMRARVEQIAAVLRGAGLTAQALTSSALALATAAYAGTVLSATPLGAELIVMSRGNLRTPTVLSTALSSDAEWMKTSIAEAVRMLAMRAADPTAAVGLWNGAALPAHSIDDLSRGLDAPVSVLKLIAGVDVSGVAQAQQCGHAVALARLSRSPDANALNFFNSKLVEKARGFFEKLNVLFAAAALFAVVALGWLAVTWYQDSNELAQLKARSDARKAETESAKAFVTRYDSSQNWYDKRPNLLDCLQELARVIPSDGSAWMTKLSVKEDFRCEMSAKAINDKRCFDVLNSIEKNQLFKDVKFVYMNKQDNKNADVAFAISFIFWKQ